MILALTKLLIINIWPYFTLSVFQHKKCKVCSVQSCAECVCACLVRMYSSWGNASWYVREQTVMLCKGLSFGGLLWGWQSAVWRFEASGLKLPSPTRPAYLPIKTPALPPAPAPSSPPLSLTPTPPAPSTPTRPSYFSHSNHVKLAVANLDNATSGKWTL